MDDDCQSLPQSMEVKYIGLDKHNLLGKIVNIFLPIIFSICFGCPKEPSQRDDSFEYPQHMFLLRNKKIIFWYALAKVLKVTFSTKSRQIALLDNKLYSLPARGEFYHLLIILANSLDPDQDQSESTTPDTDSVPKRKFLKNHLKMPSAQVVCCIIWLTLFD